MFDFDNPKKIPGLAKGNPEAMKGFQTMDETALADGVISKKNKELMPITVSLTTKCGYCLKVHRKAAIAAGATE